MNIYSFSVGSKPAQEEGLLVDKYSDRSAKLAKNLGFNFHSMQFIPASKANDYNLQKKEEGEKLVDRLNKIKPKAPIIIALDERGKNLSSEELAQTITNYINNQESIAFVIGGHSGFSEQFLATADLKLSFGRLTWPHGLVRVMLMEQIYRSLTIIAGHPYHRS